MIDLKSPAQIEHMRRAGHIVALVHQVLREAVRPGVTTRALDALAEETIRRHGALPAFKGYRGFPATICASVNEEVVHGIPGNRTLRDGDIISLDVGSIVEGYYGDAAITVAVGRISDETQRLIRVTEESLWKGIEQARPGNRISDISWAVQRHVEQAGFSVVRDFTGHGIGTHLHEDPPIPNYGPPHQGPLIKEGMVLAIEPMVNVGSPEVELLADGWTAVTKDRRLAAHCEHTVYVSASGPEVLTG